MPSFPGGGSALMSYLMTHVKYPQEASAKGIMGRVIVNFVVETDGTVSNVTVVDSKNPYLDREAARVVMSMPKWIPAKHEGQAVRVKYSLPISFQL